MPYVNVRSAMPMCDQKKALLQAEIGRIIALIPGKNIDNCMTLLEGGLSIYMSSAPAKAVFCEIRVKGAAPKESKASVVSELYDLFVKELGAEKVYTNIIESEEWGNAGKYSG